MERGRSVREEWEKEGRQGGGGGRGGAPLLLPRYHNGKRNESNAKRDGRQLIKGLQMLEEERGMRKGREEAAAFTSKKQKSERMMKGKEEE